MEDYNNLIEAPQNEDPQDGLIEGNLLMMQDGTIITEAELDDLVNEANLGEN
jgi:hypothetical protein